MKFALVYLKNLQKSSLYCSFTSHDRPDEISILQPNQLQYRLNDGGIYSFYFDDIKFEPVTISGLKHTSKGSIELSMKTAFDDSSTSIRNSNELLTDKLHLTGALQYLKDGDSLHCKFCENELADISDVSSASPAETPRGITDAASGFFCHAEDSADLLNAIATGSGHAGGKQGALLSPRELSLPPGAVTRTALTEAGRGLLRCSRCRSWTGRRHAESGAPLLLPCCLHVKLGVIDVDGDRVGDQIQPLLSDDEFVSGLFRSLLNEGLSKRFILLAVSDLGVEEIALLWLLDGDVQLYSYCDNDLDVTSRPKSVDLSAKTVQRILYMHCKSDDFETECDKWSRDMSIVQITLPIELCLLLLRALLRSTESLPVTLQGVQNFCNAFVT